MRVPRRPRGLSGEDAYLWGEIARLITPLRGRAKPAKPHAPAVASVAPAPAPVPKPAIKAPPKPLPKTLAKRQVLNPAPPAPVLPPVAAPPPPPLAPGLERKARLALRRGSLKVDARIDLHGMYQAEAHGALIGFLMRARVAGHAHVLVVTGKGGAGYDDAFSERGVLRRSVPHWLRSAELRAIVLGFEEAARHHGGAGALYVRLRRR